MSVKLDSFSIVMVPVDFDGSQLYIDENKDKAIHIKWLAKESSLLNP